MGSFQQGTDAKGCNSGSNMHGIAMYEGSLGLSATSGRSNVPGVFLTIILRTIELNASGVSIARPHIVGY